jgi:hypothetical protein
MKPPDHGCISHLTRLSRCGRVSTWEVLALNSFLTLCLLLPLALAPADKKAPPNPADYTVQVQVYASYSRTQNVGLGPQSVQVLSASLEGKQLELASESPTYGVLALGSYKAKSITVGGMRGAGAYDIFAGYELLFPDGRTRDYLVTGFIAAGQNPAPPAP